jgi:hypothetical protein
MLEPRDATQDCLLEAQVARARRSVEEIRSEAANLSERKAGELQRSFQALRAPFVINCELHASVNA